MTAVGRYRAILQTPGVKAAMGAAFVGRLPIGIHALAIVLFLRHETGSYADAGAVAAAFALGGTSAPLQGRLVDRFGQRRILVPLTLLHAAALTGLVVAGSSGAPVAVLAALALLGGLCLPPLSSVLRTLWPELLRDRPELLSTAFALDGVVIELVFTLGPLLVAVTTVALGAQWAILGACALAVVGVLWFVSLPVSRAWTPAPEAGSHGPLGALRSPGIRTLVITVLPMGFCFGTMEVALPAFADDEGRRAFAGVLLAVWSLASVAGGLWYGALTLRGSPGARYARLALLLPLGYLPLIAATSPELMVLLVIPAGLCMAPLITAANQLVGDVAPAGAVTEAYTWPITSLVGGVAAGNAAAGLLVEAVNWRAALLAAVAGAGLGALLTTRRRPTLLPGSG